jgi:sigma54-dependent transcription regulator
MTDKCPCDAVKQHEQELKIGAIAMAEIKKDIEAIKDTVAEFKQEMKTSIAELKKGMKENNDLLNQKVDAINQKPNKFWGKYGFSILQSITAILIAYLAYKLGLKN